MFHLMIINKRKMKIVKIMKKTFKIVEVEIIMVKINQLLEVKDSLLLKNYEININKI